MTKQHETAAAILAGMATGAAAFLAGGLLALAVGGAIIPERDSGVGGGSVPEWDGGLEQPDCPTEDSCFADYHDGEWHIYEARP